MKAELFRIRVVEVLFQATPNGNSCGNTAMRGLNDVSRKSGFYYGRR
jgi:hypothetical protein